MMKRPSFRPVASELVRRLSEKDVLTLADVLLLHSCVLDAPLRRDDDRPNLRLIQGGKKS